MHMGKDKESTVTAVRRWKASLCGLKQRPLLTYRAQQQVHHTGRFVMTSHKTSTRRIEKIHSELRLSTNENRKEIYT